MLDGVFAQGYLHASERLFQMQLGRRVASGRLAESQGESMLSLDILMRSLDLSGKARADMALQQKEELDLLQAYCKGINQYLEENNALPVEFYMNDLSDFHGRIDLWKPEDTLMLLRLHAFMTSHGATEEIQRAGLLQLVGFAKTEELVTEKVGRQPKYPISKTKEENSGNLDTSTNSLFASMLSCGKTPDDKDWTLHLDGLRILPNIGGNTLACPKTKSSPQDTTVMVTDLHDSESRANPFRLFQSSLFVSPNYAQRDATPGEDDALSGLDNGADMAISGVSIPGIPLFLAGQNQHTAWSWTISDIDSEDLFIERLRKREDDSGWEYLHSTNPTSSQSGGNSDCESNSHNDCSCTAIDKAHGAVWKSVLSRSESFVVKNMKTFQSSTRNFTLYETARGPLLENLGQQSTNLVLEGYSRPFMTTEELSSAFPGLRSQAPSATQKAKMCAADASGGPDKQVAIDFFDLPLTALSAQSLKQPFHVKFLSSFASARSLAEVRAATKTMHAMHWTVSAADALGAVATLATGASFKRAHGHDGSLPLIVDLFPGDPTWGTIEGIQSSDVAPENFLDPIEGREHCVLVGDLTYSSRNRSACETTRNIFERSLHDRTVKEPVRTRALLDDPTALLTSVWSEEGEALRALLLAAIGPSTCNSSSQAGSGETSTSEEKAPSNVEAAAGSCSLEASAPTCEVEMPRELCGNASLVEPLLLTFDGLYTSDALTPLLLETFRRKLIFTVLSAGHETLDATSTIESYDGMVGAAGLGSILGLRANFLPKRSARRWSFADVISALYARINGRTVAPAVDPDVGTHSSWLDSAAARLEKDRFASMKQHSQPDVQEGETVPSAEARRLTARHLVLYTLQRTISALSRESHGDWTNLSWGKKHRLRSRHLESSADTPTVLQELMAGTPRPASGSFDTFLRAPSDLHVEPGGGAEPFQAAIGASSAFRMVVRRLNTDSEGVGGSLETSFELAAAPSGRVGSRWSDFSLTNWTRWAAKALPELRPLCVDVAAPMHPIEWFSWLVGVMSEEETQRNDCLFSEITFV
jgi:hypothetical protein